MEDLTASIVDKKSFFWSPDYLEISAWIEHIPFAFWLVETFKPKMIVELGVHNGVSYFSFCQAIKTMNLNTTCYGIDTWQGDEHAGFYDSRIYDNVVSYNSSKYSGFSTLIKSTFDDAKNYFIDGSVELLHIDGLHTYEAVKHDFYNWLPKLSSNALVILHDINVRERDFGVFQLWNELKEKYAHFQFDFGHGLGVVAIGEVIQEELKILFQPYNSATYYSFLKNIFFDKGFFLQSRFYTALETQKANEKLLEDNTALTSKNRYLEETNETLKSKLRIAEASVQELTSSANKMNEQVKTLLTRSGYEINKQNPLMNEMLSAAVFLEKNKVELIEQRINEKNQFNKIEYFQKTIQWYKATYENRSILGVLKEKIKVKKKLETKSQQSDEFSSTYSYKLLPANDIILSNTKNEFISTGDDPFFLVDIKNRRIASGWYWLSIDMKKVKGILFTPRLYFDYGNGFNELDCLNLPAIINGKIERLMKVTSDIFSLRFDPTSSDAVFVINDFSLKPLNSMAALRLAILKYKETSLPDKSYLNVFTSLTRDYFKEGKVAVKKSMRDRIYNGIMIHDNYLEWCAMYDTISEDDLINIREMSDNLMYKPLFSIIMPVYNAPVNFLKLAIESVRNQVYSNWELCIADDKSTQDEVILLLKEYMKTDKRIKVVFRQQNGHISAASNSALEIANGDYIALLDQDDELSQHALYEVASAINRYPDLELIYSDEDKIDENGIRFNPYFKTDWNLDLFYGQNMINHLGVYKMSVMEKVGGFRVGYEGSQDYDLALRCIEYLNPQEIFHIPHVLYHWRAIEGSTAINSSNKNYAFEASIKALNDHLERTKQNGIVSKNLNNSLRVSWKLPSTLPKVSIIIPTKDKVEILNTCIKSILEKTEYYNYEVIIIDNKSIEPPTIEYYKKIQQEDARIKVYPYDLPFNFSAMVNKGVNECSGEVVVLLNNDTEVINSNWLIEMASQCMREGIGAVGAKLYYPNGQIQHAGVFLSEGRPGNHIYLKRGKNDNGYFNKLNLVQQYSAVTAACLAIKKDIFILVGELDEENLKVAYNDVDFCLKVQQSGYRNIWTPFAQLFHHESLSRGSDKDIHQYDRFMKEQAYMLKKWDILMGRDPFFNPNLHIDTFRTEYAFPPRVKYEWKANSNSS